MGKLEDKLKSAKFSKNDKRFYTSRDMSEAKRLESISNAMFKRGIKSKKHIHISTCSCGREGCFMFV